MEAERSGPEAVLDVLLRNAGRLPESSLRTACLNLLPKAPKRIGKFERQFGPLSPAERHRIDALAAGLMKHWDAFEDNWLEYARELVKSSDPDAALTRSVIFRHLADTALEIPDIDDPEFESDPIASWLRMSVGDLLGMPADVLRDIKAAGARTLALLETHSEREAVDILVKEFRDGAMAKICALLRLKRDLLASDGPPRRPGPATVRALLRDGAGRIWADTILPPEEG